MTADGEAHETVIDPVEHNALPPEALALALSSVSGLGPKGLRRLLDEGSPAAAWAAIRQGHPDDDGLKWRTSARGIDVRRIWELHSEHGIAVSVRGDARYPGSLSNDDEAPAVLFSRGDLSVVDQHPRVAVIGTRSATRYGLSLAAQLGSELSAAGVSVVSGLAAGIDGAAHEGACAANEAASETGVSAAAATTSAATTAATTTATTTAPPIAVVANGLESPYPRSHSGLFRRIIDCGVVLSEAPAGIPPARWRFPQRNRILAALADVVVVVECHLQGGSLITVKEAADRGVIVGAVPGSVRSPASAGSNDLLADGCFVVRDVTDVLVAVDLARAGDVPVRPLAARAPRQGRSEGAPQGTKRRLRSAGAASLTDPVERAVHEALDSHPTSVEQIMVSTGRSLADVSQALEHLSAVGIVIGEAGWWQLDE